MKDIVLVHGVLDSAIIPNKEEKNFDDSLFDQERSVAGPPSTNEHYSGITVHKLV